MKMALLTVLLKTCALVFINKKEQTTKSTITTIITAMAPYQKIHANLSKKETHEINVSELMLPDVKPRVKFKLSSPELTSSGRHHIEIKFLAYAHLSLCYHDHAEVSLFSSLLSKNIILALKSPLKIIKYFVKLYRSLLLNLT
uniref:Uncharacterized protein n=1 Tax=Glossina palpalis gambiensis TaxID=67801 RepID=A0A1B0AUI7_9MUSC